MRAPFCRVTNAHSGAAVRNETMALRCVTPSATGPRVRKTAATIGATTVRSVRRRRGFGFALSPSLRHECHLAYAPRRKPRAPQAVRGQQLVERALSDP